MQTTTIVNSVNQLENSEKNDQRRLDIINKHNNNDDLNSISVKRPQFPPNIDIEPLVANLLKHKTKNPKMPNEFFIYRAALVKELKSNNYKLKMTRLSALASDSWSREPPSVKSAYRKLARETERQYLSARALELPNLAKSLNDNTEKASQKKKIKNHPVSKLVNVTSNNKKESVNNSVNTRLENDNNTAITALSGINNMVNVTTVTQVTQPTLQYPSQVLAQPYEDDFTLIGDNPQFVMRRFDDQNEIYLIQPPEKNIMYTTYNIDNSPISAYSSENSSPTSVYWSNPNSPSLPLGSTNISEENNFFAPLPPPSIYEFNINDISQNYPPFYLQ